MKILDIMFSCMLVGCLHVVFFFYPDATFRYFCLVSINSSLCFGYLSCILAWFFFLLLLSQYILNTIYFYIPNLQIHFSNKALLAPLRFSPLFVVMLRSSRGKGEKKKKTLLNTKAVTPPPPPSLELFRECNDEH